MGHYDVALICKNGHLINSVSQGNSAVNKAYCNKCGGEAISTCESCNKAIRGGYVPDGLFYSPNSYSVPSYCEHCGKPYPWISSKLEAAAELTELISELSEDEKKILVSSLDDLVRDTPKTQVAAHKFKKILTGTSKQIASSFREILIDVVSEAAKKTLWP